MTVSLAHFTHSLSPVAALVATVCMQRATPGGVAVAAGGWRDCFDRVSSDAAVERDGPGARALSFRFEVGGFS